MAQIGKYFQPMAKSLPTLLFFTKSTSGPARRMESLLAHLARKERDRLRVSRIDIDASPEWAERFAIEDVPSLVLIKKRRPVARLEGRVSAPQIERMLDPHLDGASAAAA
jgi:thioredoxin 1